MKIKSLTLCCDKLKEDFHVEHFEYFEKEAENVKN
jgi:hypothetical protein